MPFLLSMASHILLTYPPLPSLALKDLSLDYQRGFFKWRSHLKLTLKLTGILTDKDNHLDTLGECHFLRYTTPGDREAVASFITSSLNRDIIGHIYTEAGERIFLGFRGEPVGAEIAMRYPYVLITYLFQEAMIRDRLGDGEKVARRNIIMLG